MPILTEKFEQALVYANSIHREQMRKGTDIPYMSHLMSVAALTLEHGGDEDQAIAALLHDAAEDCGGHERLSDIRNKFGDGVADMVSDCTDGWTEPKPDWRPRKEAYIASITTKRERSLLVTLADKTHNARTIVADLENIGDNIWSRFSAERDEVIWYYESLASALGLRMNVRLVDELHRCTALMRAG